MTSPDGAVPSGSLVESTTATNDVSTLTDGRTAAYSSNPSVVQNYTQQTFQAMTSGAVTKVMQQANVSLGNYVTAAIDELLAGLCQALAGIEILGVEPFAFLNGWAQDLTVQASSALSTAGAAQTTSMANSTQIAALQTQQTQSAVGGGSIYDGFQTWDAANWNTLNIGGAAGITVSGGQAGINQTGDTDSGGTGLSMAMWKTPLMTDQETVSIVLGNPNQGGNTYSGVMIRAAADFSTFVWAAVETGAVALGYGTATSTGAVLNSWTSSTNISVSQGDTLTLTANGNTYTVMVNGIGILDWIDTGGQSPVGHNNRSVGFLCSLYVNVFTWFSFNVAAFSAADTTPPAVVGTGWSIYRANTATVSQPAGANQISGSVYDTVRESNGCTIANLGSGQIQIGKAGWYVMSVGVNWNAACGTNYNYYAYLWSAPSPTGQFSLVRAGGDTSGSTVYSSEATFVVFAPAGSVWAPGYYIAGPNSLIGDANGIGNYFDGTLCSFS
jgi:hypothetical protein